ncbi:hypothetical protein DFH11DRAFT_1722720 [Phellopilus nigrolimitatus]|nr:hypothetical protein DFH11DRAFT_1722720 [Phellopilus nigrolimitatus]
MYNNIHNHASSYDFPPDENPKSWIYMYDAGTYAYHPPTSGRRSRHGRTSGRCEERHERRRERQIDLHLNHLQRLGYVPPAPASSYHVPYHQGIGQQGYAQLPQNYVQPPQNYPPNYGQYPSNYEQPLPNYPPNYVQPPPNYPPNYIQPPPNVAYTAHNGVQVEQQDVKKKWYELDDKKRNALLAGGLVVGLAAVAGGAYYVHSKHQKEGEEKQAQAWDLQNWMMSANTRTEAFMRDGPKAPTTWIYSAHLESHLDSLKKDLIPGGEEDGQPWFIGRAPHNGGIQIGRCRPDEGAFVGYDHEAVHVNYYETLVGDAKGVKWVPHKGHLSISALGGAQPIEGGHENDGTPLAIARACVHEKQGVMGIGAGGKEGIFPGKASTKLDGAYVTVGDKEVKVEKYEVLCYA